MKEWQTNADRWYHYYNIFRKEGLSPETSQRLANVQIEREVKNNASVESKTRK